MPRRAGKGAPRGSGPQLSAERRRAAMAATEMSEDAQECVACLRAAGLCRADAPHKGPEALEANEVSGSRKAMRVQ